MSAFDDVEVLGLTSPARVRIAPGPSPGEAAADSAVGRAWARRRAENPALRNDPILSVVTLDAATGELTARRETYQRLVVQPAVMTGVRLLAVTGVVTARLPSGEACVLLGRRAFTTRMYGGMWEMGPAGGVHVPPASVTELDEKALGDALGDEMEEEIGLRLAAARAVAIVRNRPAFSDDVVMRVELEGPPPRVSPANWEYLEARWLGVSEIARFDAMHGAEVIPAARALWRFLGYVPG